MILLSIGLSILSGMLYRIGGSSLPISNITKIRDAGVPFIGCILVAIDHWPLNGMSWLGLILSFGLSWGAMTTYFKKKGTDAKWWNWMLVGLAFGIAFLPFAWASGLWIPFLIRTAITTIAITAWCEAIGWDIAEEFGRGFIYCISLLIL